MVAAVAANQAPDVSVASELGSLLLCHRSIPDPRWRLDAAVRLVPMYQQLGISLDAIRAEVRRGVAAAVCVPAWREHLQGFMLGTVERGCVESLRLAIDALWTRGEKHTKDRARSAACSLEPHYMNLLARPSLSGLARLVATIDRRDDVIEAERVARVLRPREQPMAEAHLARLTLRFAVGEFNTPMTVEGLYWRSQPLA